jgi:hypothetical protein
MTIAARTIACLLAVGLLLGLCTYTDAGLGDIGKALKVGKKLVDEDKKKKEESSQKEKADGEKGSAASVGKAEPGNIVFSKTPIKPEKAEKLTNEFKAGDDIYAVVYPQKTFEEMAGGQKNLILEFKCFLDGKYDSAGSYSLKLKGDALQRKALVLDLSPEAKKMTAYKDEGVEYKSEFEKYGKRAGPMKFTRFLSNLKPGKHTIKLTAYHYGDMAVGEFTISGDDYKTPYDKRFKELDEASTAGKSMPEPKMDDAKLEAAMYKALKNSKVKEAKDGEVLQIVIMDSGWNIERHKISGAVLGRHIRAMTAIKEKSGPCWMWQFTFRQDFIGNEFQPLKLDGIYEREKINEENVKKETFQE